MPSRKQARLAEIRRYVEDRGTGPIDEAQAAELQALLRPIAAATLQKLLRESGVPLSPVVEGVRQDDFDQLERTLTALAAEYEKADRERARWLRRAVITAKEHARFAALRAKDEPRRQIKEEMLEWILVWLENPGIFAQWARLRRGSGLVS